MNSYDTQSPGLTDDELVEGYLKGDISCFDQIMKRYRGRLFNYIYRHIGYKQQAEDIFQEVFGRVIDHLAHYRKKGSFCAWIFKIALNMCRDHARRKKKISTLSLNQPFPSKEGEEITLENLVASNGLSPVADVHKKEVHSLLQEAIRCLPPKQKEVLILRIYAGLSFKETSQVLHCPINTALARMQYALQNLREKLKEKGVEDEL